MFEYINFAKVAPKVNPTSFLIPSMASQVDPRSATFRPANKEGPTNHIGAPAGATALRSTRDHPKDFPLGLRTGGNPWEKTGAPASRSYITDPTLERFL